MKKILIMVFGGILIITGMISITKLVIATSSIEPTSKTITTSANNINTEASIAIIEQSSYTMQSSIEEDQTLHIDYDKIDLKTTKKEYIYTPEEINYFLGRYTSEESLLHNQGEAFYKASQKTGYIPCFLVALAAQESGWEVSSLHAGKNNPYSIAMYDWDVTQGYTMGETFSDGIINGAIWISDNYYDNYQKSLYEMQHKDASHIYASDPQWEYNIASIMETMHDEILTYRKGVNI